MTKFIWIYGPTAVGKETLINKIINDSNHPVIDLLKLEKPLYAHTEALALRHDARADIVNKISNSKDVAATILIKTQGYDAYRDLPIKLLEQLPYDSHLLVYLDAETSIIRSRRIKRGEQSTDWPDEEDRRTNAQYAIDLELKGMPTVWLNNDGPSPVISVRPSF
jgi:GTPase SAR1 family protein